VGEECGHGTWARQDEVPPRRQQLRFQESRLQLRREVEESAILTLQTQAAAETMPAWRQGIERDRRTTLGLPLDTQHEVMVIEVGEDLADAGGAGPLNQIEALVDLPTTQELSAAPRQNPQYLTLGRRATPVG
jgi:hypothetical protein